MYDRYSLEEGKMKTSFRDWRQALRTPATYRVGNAVRIQPQFVILIILAGSFFLILFYNMSAFTDTTAVSNKPVWLSGDRQYNAVYPLTKPVIHKGIYTYKIAIVADLDKKSRSIKNHDSYMSYVRTGFLSYSEQDEIVKIQWDLVDTTIPIFSSYSQNGRGMELSELITYNSKILTFDDRSGLVFEMVQQNLIPWVVLADGNGQTAKGFKSEWATIKDGLLYVGSIGKEWTSSNGSFENDNPMWIKVVNAKGEVHHLNWSKEYKALRKSIGIEWPGYMIHESAAWSPTHNKWYFLPRRCSHNVYDEAKDEVMGCNYLITADEGFKNIDAIEITKRKPKFGFSSFKFVPRTNEEVIVALKTTEFEGHTATYITVIKSNGKELLSDQFIDDIKYEGIEFI